MCLADVAWPDGSDVVASPRQILRRQLARLAERGWSANAGTELEFLVFQDTYEQAWHKGYRELSPGKPLQRRLLAAGHRARGAADPPHPQQHGRGGDGRGGLQGRVQLRPARDQLPLRRRAAHRRRALDLQERREGDRGAGGRWRSRSWPSSTSARATRVTSTSRWPTSKGPLFARDEALFHSFLAGQLACLRELTLLLAPHVNSYKRYAAGSFAPTTVAWGHDNRTCSLRVVGHGPSLRFENRVGGADLNPYLALSAIIASGLHGIDAGLELEPALEGNAYAARERPRAAGDAARTRASCSPPATSRARRSARTSSRTTSTRRTSSSRRSSRRSPTGSAYGDSSDCERVGARGDGERRRGS